MRRSHWAFAFFVLFGGGMVAFAQSDPPALVARESDTVFTLAPYLWAPSFKGDVGVGPVTVPVDENFSDYMQNFNGGLLLLGELRQDRWSLLVDGILMRIEDDSNTPGPAFSMVNVQMDMLLVEAAVAYDVSPFEKLRAQILAGARYVYMSTDLDLTEDVAAASAATEEVFDRTVDKVTSTVQGAVNDKKNTISERALQNPHPVGEQVGRAIEDLKVGIDPSTVNDELQRIDGSFPDVANIAVREQREYAEALQNAIAERSKDLVEEKLTPAERLDSKKVAGVIDQAASESVSSLKKNVSSSASKALGKAEDNLVAAVGQSVTEAANQDVSASADWVDPFVGTRLAYALTDRLALVLEGDIGGFDVGSELTWQLAGGLAWKASDRTTVQAGYRHMDIDYEKDAFKMDVALSGFAIGVGFRL